MQADLDESLLDFLDDALTADDDQPAGRAPVPSREQWGRTPDALAAQQRSTDLLPGSTDV